jgi:acid phosphatase type 7
MSPRIQGSVISLITGWIRKSLLWVIFFAFLSVFGSHELLGVQRLAGGILRGPFLQSVTTDSVWVVWDTATPSSARVEYGATPELGQVLEDQASVLHHELQITGLMPYTRYYYRVVNGTAPSTFRTAGKPDQDHFRFAVLGDTRDGGQAHRDLIAQMVKAEPDFVIHTGDMVGAGSVPVLWNEFFQIEAPLLRMAPFFPTLGNHEEDDLPRINSLYFDIFHLPGNERWYSFDYGNAHFICLKTDGFPGGAAVPDDDQMAWLENNLAHNRLPWRFVFFHVSVFTSHAEDGLELLMRKRLTPILELYHISGVFTGHDHSYERLLVNGVNYIVAAAGGAPLYPFTTHEAGSQASAQDNVFTVIDVSGTRLTGQTIDRQGKVIDTFSWIDG